MDAVEKKVTYEVANPYLTLNQPGAETRNIWVVFHGMGQLSRYFLKRFGELNRNENYIIAPQAPSRYYLNNEFRHVGGSWLTKEYTDGEMENILHYLDAISAAEDLDQADKLIVLGFSQGVSIAARWVARRKIRCRQLVFYAGGFPAELQRSDFEFLPETSRVTAVMGDKDHYITPERAIQEKEKLDTVFTSRMEYIGFEGGHELLPNILNQFTS